MNLKEIMKTLAPGFLPLIIFILADSFWGLKTALIVSVVVGLIELSITYLKEKRIDSFVLVDMALLILLSVFSAILDNPVYFKLKPAVLEGIITIFLAYSAFSSSDILMTLLGRYTGKKEFNAQEKFILSKQLKIMFYIFLLHTLLILYSVFFMSKEAWVFISGGLFYIIFIVYFIGSFLWKKLEIVIWRLTYGKEEWLPVLDSLGRVIASAPKTVCVKRGYLTPRIHLYLMDNENKLLLKKNNSLVGELSDTQITNNVNMEELIMNELKTLLHGEFMLNLSCIDTYIEDEKFIYVFIAKINNRFTSKNFEVWKLKRIKEQIHKDIFSTNFQRDFSSILKIY